jgi:hypothetical protein
VSEPAPGAPRAEEGGSPPPLAQRPAQVPVRATVAEAWRLMLKVPRAVVLPSLVVQLPVAAVLAIVTAWLFLGLYAEEPFILVGEITSETHRGVAFALVAITAIQVLFGQVARAATIVAVAAAASGSPRPLAQVLDPAFTRMGAIITQTVVLAAVGAALLLSLVGVILFPYIAGRLAVSTEIMMLEGQRPLQALVGSWRMTARRVIRLLSVLLLVALISAGPLIIASLLGLFIGGTRTEQVLWASAMMVVQAAIALPAVALITAAITLFYLKAREIDSGRRPG